MKYENKWDMERRKGGWEYGTHACWISHLKYVGFLTWKHPQTPKIQRWNKENREGYEEKRGKVGR